MKVVCYRAVVFVCSTHFNNIITIFICITKTLLPFSFALQQRYYHFRIHCNNRFYYLNMVYLFLFTIDKFYGINTSDFFSFQVFVMPGVLAGSLTF